MKSNARIRHVWHRWERFSRLGVKLNNRRYSSGQVLSVWALIITVAYILLWTSHRHHYQLQSTTSSSDLSSTEIDEKFWRDRHLIFCISPGRAGSKYLQNVLDVSENMIARHEPEPKMTGQYLQNVILDGKREETFEERAHIKLNAIREVLEGTSVNVVYAETSHMFIKTFEDVVLQKLGNVAQISIIFLHRPAKNTIYSQLQLGWFTKGHSGKNNWYYDASDVHASERQSSFRTNSSSRLDALIGYNVDVLQRGLQLDKEIRRRHKRKEWKHVRIFESLLMDISGEAEAGVYRLLSNMGLTVDEKKLSLLSTHDKNARNVKKDRFNNYSRIEDVESKLDYYRNNVPFLRQVLYS